MLDVLLKIFPIGAAEKMSVISPLIPYYHMISDERLSHVCHLYPYKNLSQFIGDIEFLVSRYEPISLQDLSDHVKHGRKLKNGSFLLTFDDGFSQNYSTVAPILLKKGIPAVFFLSTDFIDNRALCYKNKASIIIDYLSSHGECLLHAKQELPFFRDTPLQDMPKIILSIKYKNRNILDKLAETWGIDFDEYLIKNQPYLSSEQIRRMIEMGFCFGAHSIDHPLYAELSLEEQLTQTIGSLQFMKKNFDLSYSVFAFPHNDSSVSNKFFCIIEKYADLTFGTSGIKTDSAPMNVQRINFEKTLEPAKKILIRAFIKKRLYKLLGRADITRV
jgi:hypothetical protein